MSNEHPRITREKKTIEAMVQLYCRKHHTTGKDLCSDCLEFLEYAKKRLDNCPFQEKKSTCGKCLIHCYKPDMKIKVKKIMRYSGPRILLHHPILALHHVWDGRKKPLKLNKQSKKNDSALQIFIAYDSKYGNTKRVAEKIAEGIQLVEGVGVELGYVKEINPENLASYNLIVIGAPNHMGKPSRTARKFVEKLAQLRLETKQFAVFDTYFAKPKNYFKAARKMEQKLQENFSTLNLLLPSLSIKVTGIKGPIADGELSKSMEFGKQLAFKLKNA